VVLVARGHRPGREAGAGGDRDPYVFPRSSAEHTRLDVQHHALREALGANYWAPIGRGPGFILDAGSGSGQWAFDLCGEFEDALVVGFDLEPGPLPWPDRYRFVRGNLLNPLPFLEDRFDFTHQRLLISGIPVSSWVQVVAELMRVTRPGGWIELVDGAPWIDQPGPATERLCELLCQLARMRGLDSTGVVFRSLATYLEGAGASEIHVQSLTVPIGTWAGRAGSLMATSYGAMFSRLGPAFTARLGISDEECRTLVATMSEEWDANRSFYSMTVAYGRK
jgi:SAM-dependent methyltransferase